MELFTKKGSRYSKPKISISTAGQIGLNAACMSKYIKGKKFVLLYGDKEKGLIGIKPVETEQENSFRISYTKTKSNSTGSIAGRSFLSYFGIDYSERKSYIPEWNEKEGIISVKI